MSDVISFRLDKDNPREEKARQVLKAWYEEGYSLRYFMTEALLKLYEQHLAPVEEAMLEEVNENLNRISQLLERIGNSQSLGVAELVGEPAQAELTAGFIGMIRRGAKSGLKYDL